MRKGWLIAAAIGGAASVSQAAEVQLFGIHVPGTGNWGVYARISDVNSTLDGLEVDGLASIGINVLNKTVAGTGSTTVLTARKALPYVRRTNFTDPATFPVGTPAESAPDAPTVGAGFWLVRNNGTVNAATGVTGITAAQFLLYDQTSAAAPYKDLVVSGVGVNRGSIPNSGATASAPGGTDPSIRSWSAPVLVASGTFTPAGPTGAASQLGLTLEYYNGGPGVNFARRAGVDWEPEPVQAGKALVVDAKTGTVTNSSTVRGVGGDSDLSGTVDFTDLLALAKNYNQSSRSWFEGDFDFDGAVGFADLLALAKNYNKAQPADLPEFGATFNADMSRAFAAVPEPGTLGFVGIGLMGLMARRRRK